MSDLEQNGIVTDEEPQSSDSKLSSEDLDTSNNSVSAKASTGYLKGKAQKQGGKRDSARRKQAVRQREFQEKLKQNGYAMDGRTKTFLDHLFRPTLDGRDVKSKVFKNQLMLSENLDEVPSGFAKNWMMLVCPVGSRCLVVANKGHTGAYTKSGYHIISHPSNLPMGNMMYHEGTSGPCVLDCIYCNEMDTYFVLDLMCWDGQPLFNCDTHTRQKLLHEKVREYNLNRHSHVNPIDGLLFLHKQLNYISGPNPLCLWLTLDRLPIKMKIEIPDLGIVACHNYSDPISLALAHGVSPAIISQVYPSPGGPHPPRHSYQQKSGPQSQRHGYQQNSGSYPFFQQQQRPHHQKGWSNRGAGPTPNGMAYLAEMMAGMNMRYPHGNDHSQYGMNNSNARMSKGGRYHQDHFQIRRNGQQSHDYYHKKQEKKNKKKAGRPKKPDQPKNANWEESHGVMKSQWIGTEKPENFEENFLTCICPMSKRRIIVASGGTTCTYNKYGKLVDTFSSPLPNGSVDSTGSEDTDLTVLDSLWCGSAQRFLVIDVMHWKQQSFYDSEADYRFSWLADNFSNINLMSGQREFPVELLTKHDSNETTITAALNKVEFKVDGLLCFKKESTYSKLASVNALWMKLDMMESFLGYSPSAVNFKPTTEKEKKQRDYFIGLGAKKDGENVIQNGQKEAENEKNGFNEAGETEC